jgi:hypothetical protein
MPTTLTRSLLVILIPGAIAIAPWLLALVQHTSATLGLDQYRPLSYVLLFACAAVAGSVFEGLGRFVEVRWDKEREATYAVRENWFKYLSRSLDNEPVGFRYLSRRATTLYFELSMMFAVPIFAFGAGILASLRFREHAYWIAGVSVLAVVVSVVYFYWQARCTHELLCKTRMEINARLGS